jgi:hypothetical protein
MRQDVGTKFNDIRQVISEVTDIAHVDVNIKNIFVQTNKNLVTHGEKENVM